MSGLFFFLAYIVWIPIAIAFEEYRYQRQWRRDRQHVRSGRR